VASNPSFQESANVPSMSNTIACNLLWSRWIGIRDVDDDDDDDDDADDDSPSKEEEDTLCLTVPVAMVRQLSLPNLRGRMSPPLDGVVVVRVTTKLKEEDGCVAK
jgi:hypothetical protein